jgi:hypothetical protein
MLLSDLERSGTLRHHLFHSVSLSELEVNNFDNVS